LDRILRGMIVVLLDPKGSNDILTKRVIGLPGEKFEVRQGAVYINNEKLDEPYIAEPARYDFARIKIPDNAYMLLGDNRNNSEDSSIWGPVEKQLILGRVFCRYWPIKKLGFFLQP
ncbi:MAG TPA: signal peptidase I, partial [bacterium]|nr:signal peptidase I [bacterium]